MKGGEGPSQRGAVLSRLSRVPRWCGLCLVKFYQCCISPLFPACCRYIPTCSQYAVEALERFGLLKGSWLALKRILRCHPFHEGGYDPVPQEFSWLAPDSRLRRRRPSCSRTPHGEGSGEDGR